MSTEHRHVIGVGVRKQIRGHCQADYVIVCAKVARIAQRSRCNGAVDVIAANERVGSIQIHRPVIGHIHGVTIATAAATKDDRVEQDRQDRVAGRCAAP